MREIKHSCGHANRVDLSAGPYLEEKHNLEWFSVRCCPNCLDNGRRGYLALLPELVGVDKDKADAVRIQVAERLLSFRVVTEYLPKESSYYHMREVCRKVVDELFANTDTAFWLACDAKQYNRDWVENRYHELAESSSCANPQGV